MLVLFRIVQADIATVNLNATIFWWNDSVNISGIATYTNGTGIASSTVAVTVGGVTCSNTTDVNGNYNCIFRAPLELGTYTANINVTNSSGSTFTNSTSLIVKPTYGETPVGSVSRSVIEVPMLLQEPSGRIRKVIVRITVWPG